MPKRSTYPIGLDISDGAIKFVQLNKVKNIIIIQAFGKYNLPEGAISKGVVKDEETTAGAIKNMLAKPKYGQVTGNDAVACLPEPSSYLKLIDIDSGPNEISNIIGAEIEKNIPVSIKDVYFDWQITQRSESACTALVGLAPKNTVNSYVSLLQKAGLSISAFELEPVSLCRSLLGEESPYYTGKHENNHCIIDIGAKRSMLAIYSRKTIALSVSLPIAGDVITDQIAETLNFKKTQAEKAKIVCGLDKNKANGIIYEILSKTIDELISKIRHSIDYFQEHHPGYGPITDIILCGGGSKIKNLDKLIEEKTSVKTLIGNPFENINVVDEKIISKLVDTYEFGSDDGRKSAIEQDVSTSYATSVGLALRDIFIEN